MFLTRASETTIQRFLSTFSVLGLTGPRQSGKSTLLRHLLKDYQYVTFDDSRNIDYFNEDPKGFMKAYGNKAIFDEVQFVPRIFNEVKIAVDNDRQNKGKYVLTGSNQFAYLKSVSESLAGRIGLMTLLPFQYSEMPKALLETSIYAGGYPELVLNDYRESDLWYASYLDTYLNKDVHTLSNIGDLHDFKKLIQLLATRTGQVLDMSHFANALSVSVPTIKRWVSILEALYIIFLLPPYHNNMGKRLVKRPKVYFYDTGLVSHLTGIKNQDLYQKGPMLGPIFENYVISEIIKKNIHYATQANFYFYRTRDQSEVDLIVDFKTHQHWIEIKHTHTFKPSMLNTLKKVCSNNNSEGYLLYNGEQFPQQKPIKILHFSDYLMEFSHDKTSN